MRLDELANRAGIPGQANSLLTGPVLGTPNPAHASPIVKLRRTLAALWPRVFYFLKPSDPPPEMVSPSDAVARLNNLLRGRVSFADLELELRQLSKQRMFELRSPRIFLDAPITRAAHAQSRNLETNASPTDVLTY